MVIVIIIITIIKVGIFNKIIITVDVLGDDDLRCVFNMLKFNTMPGIYERLRRWKIQVVIVISIDYYCVILIVVTSSDLKIPDCLDVLCSFLAFLL